MLDKPAGLTSHACVARIRRCYGLRRVGHGGTLDPAVTGVLPIAVGPATRLLPYLEGHKAYRGVVQFGLTTGTDDLEGEVLSRFPLPQLAEADLEELLGRFRGPQLQRPPRVSAVHLDGERAYVRARRGEAMELPLRPVTLHEVRLLHWDAGAGRLELSVRCSAGTYLRSLARDLGEALGGGGALASLRRTEALGFGLEGAVPLEELVADPPPPLKDPLEALVHLPHQRLAEDQLSGWRCGRPLEATAVHPVDQPVVMLTPGGNLAGIARATGEALLQPRLVLEAAG